MAQKVYGNSQVLCGGRFISGPDGRSCAATVLMVVVPSVAWQLTVGKFFGEQYSGLVPFVGAVLLLASLVLLLATAFSDPGIMPRQKDATEQEDPLTGARRTKQPQRYYDIILRGHTFKLKYCVTCNIYRPPRCTHCSVCENCVERFDHHCPWIGNCVGKRNYWLFYNFVSATGALNAFSLATAAAHVGIRCQEIELEQGEDSTNAFVETLRQEPFSAALTIYCTLLVWFTVGLCLYHSYLICTNQTTYEQIKGLYSSGNNPFSRGGPVANCSDVLCSGVRPRYFDGRTGQLRWPTADKGSVRELKLYTPDTSPELPAVDPAWDGFAPAMPPAGAAHGAEERSKTPAFTSASKEPAAVALTAPLAAISKDGPQPPPWSLAGAMVGGGPTQDASASAPQRHHLPQQQQQQQQQQQRQPSSAASAATSRARSEGSRGERDRPRPLQDPPSQGLHHSEL